MSDLPIPILSHDAPCEAPVSVIDSTENPLKHKNTSKPCFNPETCHTAKTVQKKSDLEKIQDLLAWKPWEISEKIEIRRGQFGIGVFAKEDLEIDELLFFAQPCQTIRIENALEVIESELEITEDDVKGHLDCADTLAVYILFELRKGRASDIWPYLATMPEEYTTPLDYWQMELHDFLTPAAHDFLFLAVSDYHDSFTKLTSFLEKYNVAEPEFHRAYSIVTTRYYYADGPATHPDWFVSGMGESDCGALGPVFDLWNHESLKPNTDWNVGEDGSMTMTVQETVQAGEELFISYGVEENVRMAQTYGFTIEDPSKVEDNIYIYKDEIVEACIARLGKSYTECDDRISHLLVENDEEGGHIDFECNVESDPLKRIFESDKPDDDNDHNKASRLLRGALHIIYDRKALLEELLNEINVALEDDSDEEHRDHKHMAKNIATSELATVTKCITQMEALALAYERNF